MTKDEAIEQVGDIVHSEQWGRFTTGAAEALGISLERFLRFAQLNDDRKKKVITALWKSLSTKQHGHCGQ